MRQKQNRNLYKKKAKKKLQFENKTENENVKDAKMV